MGKCSKCGKKIEYNNFVVIDGIVYHRECAPKIEVSPPLNNEPIDKEFLKKVDKELEEVIGGKIELTIKEPELKMTEEKTKHGVKRNRRKANKKPRKRNK